MGGGMKYYLLIILLWILPKIGLAQEVISDEAVDELIGQAVFAEDPRESPIEPGGTRSIRMAVDTIGSLGVVYRWSASSTRVAWISGLYGPKIPIFVDSLDPALQNG